jgi:WD40 repeat protein
MGADGPALIPIVLRGHDDQVTSLGFSADGRLLVTASFDRTSLVCDLASADPASNVLVLHRLASNVIALALTSDARLLATAGDDDAVRLWDLRLDELIALARLTAGRELTVEERRQYLISE